MNLTDKFLPIVYRIAADKDNLKRAKSCEKLTKAFTLGFGLFISHNQIKCDSDGWWEWKGLKTTDELILYYEKESDYFSKIIDNQ